MKFDYYTISSLIIITITLLILILSNIFKPSIKILNKELSLFWIIPLISIILLIIFNDISFKEIITNISKDTSINPIKLIILFFSMTLLSIFLDEIGFFRYIVYKISLKLKSNQYKLFFGLYILISLLTIFTSNDIIILTFTPFICYLTTRSNINPIPYLIMEFISANTMSMGLIIGNPTNIYLASTYNISFIDYFIKMIIPTLSVSLVSILIMFLLFNKDLKKKVEVDSSKIDKPNTILLIIGLSILLLTTLLLALSSYISINIEMYKIASIGALIELIFISIYSLIYKDKLIIKVIERIPYNLLPFILSMFSIVIVLNKIGLTSYLYNLLLLSNKPILVYGVSGVIIANLINNIPMSLLYSYLIDISNINTLYASIISSNIAAYITPLGALAGLMFINLLNKYDIKLKFSKFSMYGLIIGIPSLLIGLVVLGLV